MKTDGMKVINDFIKPEVDNYILKGIAQTRDENQELQKKVDEISG
jgi:chromosome segregation ATPase